MPGTRTAYIRVMDTLKTFINTTLQGTAWFPATPEVVTLFIVLLLEQGRAPASVLSTLSAIAYFHKLYNRPDPTTNFIIRKIIQGASKVQPQVDIRAPITPAILAKLCGSLSILHIPSYQVIMFKAMFTLMFHAFFRIGEVTSSLNNIQFPSITLFPSSIHLQLTSYKHHSGPPVTLVVHSTRENCPVSAMTSYLLIRGNASGPLFTFQYNKPVSPKFFSTIFNQCLDKLSLNPICYKLHSFCIGAATWSFTNGISVDCIQKCGHWKSQAFKRYIRNQLVNTNK